MSQILHAPSIAQTRTVTPGVPQDTTNQRFGRSLQTIEQFMQSAARALNSIENRLRNLENSTSGGAAWPDAWYEITPAATIEVDPGTSGRQILTPDQNIVINLTTGYTGDDELYLIIQQGATPRTITFDADWKLDDSFRPELTANAYTAYNFSFKAGVPYLKNLPIIGQL